MRKFTAQDLILDSGTQSKTASAEDVGTQCNDSVATFQTKIDASKHRPRHIRGSERNVLIFVVIPHVDDFVQIFCCVGGIDDKKAHEVSMLA